MPSGGYSGYSMIGKGQAWPFPAESGKVSWCPARENMQKHDRFIAVLARLLDLALVCVGFRIAR